MNLPDAFIQQTRALTGAGEYDKLAASLLQPSPVSIRLNNGKPFIAPPAEADRVPWCADGYYLASRPAFTFDPLFHAGCYYVQEASSMFAGQALRQYTTGVVRALDLCAAPGGKSTLMRSVLPGGSLLVSNEVIRSRSQILAENVIKWGHPGVAVTNNDPADFARLPHFFDIVLADVPCSGEGMFRKDPGAVSEWSPANVEICAQRQRRIIAGVWPSLKPGGLLIYSTCTYNTKENEENIGWIREELGAEVLPLDTPSGWQVTGNLLNGDFPVYRFLPHKTKGEGFFLAVLRKGDEELRQAKYRPAGKKKNTAAIRFPGQWLCHPEEYKFALNGSLITAFPTSLSDEMELLQNHLRVVHHGITLGEAKGKDIIPAHSLAMSTELNRDAFTSGDVSSEQAITYLRREAILLDANVPKGYVLLTYKNVPLGFVKNIGNRANNLYPNEWRIRSKQPLPAEGTCFF